MDPGVLCVMIYGMILMQELPVVSWAIAEMVRNDYCYMQYNNDKLSFFKAWVLIRVPV